MREIKFRAWHKTSQKMLHTELELLSAKQEPRMAEVEDIFIGHYFNHPAFIFMQYTGLKDNTKWEQLAIEEQKAWLATGGTKESWNGKEIYEGDIVRNINWGQKERWWGVVIWRVTEFCVSYHKPNNKTWTELTCLANGDCSQWEVIGNIYENEDLL